MSNETVMATDTSVSQFIVYDEMACEVLLKTTDEKEARAKAYNHQCVLFKDGHVLHDYSCDW